MELRSQYFRDRLVVKFRVHESALEKGSISMSPMGGLLLSQSPMLTTCFTHTDTRCKTTRALLEAIVVEFNISRKQDDFVFCGRRVRVTPEALVVSQEFAASPLLPMELCGPQRSAEIR